MSVVHDFRTKIFAEKEKAYRRGDMKTYQLLLKILQDDGLVERLALIMDQSNKDKPQ